MSGARVRHVERDGQDLVSVGHDEIVERALVSSRRHQRGT